MQNSKILSYSLTIGERMLCSGAEVGRVEDTIKRICMAYGAERVDVFTITSSIVVSAVFDGDTITQTRRITLYETDFAKLDFLNGLSRSICNTRPSEDYIAGKLKESMHIKKYPYFAQCIAWAMVAGAFTVFFGGTLPEGIVSAVIGAFVRLSVSLTEKIKLNKVFSNVVSSFVICTLAGLVEITNFGLSADAIIIGNIMLLIPGIAFTNSIRDMISGDIIAGTLRLCEAILIALAIAAGFVLSSIVIGGAV